LWKEIEMRRSTASALAVALASTSVYASGNLSNHAIALSHRTDQFGPQVASFGDATFGQFSFAQINHAGNVLFGGSYFDASPAFGGSYITNGNVPGIWRHDPGTGLTVVARERSITGGSTNVFNSLEYARLDLDGSVMFASLAGSKRSLYRQNGSDAPRAVAQADATNDLGPDLASTSYSGNGGSITANSNDALVHNGHVPFEATLNTGGSINFNNYHTLSRVVESAPNQILLRSNNAAAAPFSSQVYFNNFNLSGVNASGDIVFLASLNSGQFGQSFFGRFRNDTGTIQYVAVSNTTGATGPNIPGSPSSTMTFLSGAGDIGINNAGDMVFFGRISSGNPQYLMRRGNNDAANTFLARPGDSLGLPAGRTLANFNATASPVIAGDSTVFVTGTVTGGTAGARALWKHSTTSGFTPLLITSTDGPLGPNMGSGIFFSDIHSLNANAFGELAFFAPIWGPGVTGNTDGALWVYRDDAIEMVVREGQLFDIDPTDAIDQRTIKEIALPGFLMNTGGQDGRMSYMNDDGAIVLSLSFTDNTAGVFVLPGPRSVIPEPATMALLAGGVLMLRRR
jgi:hypothetical protein